MLNTYLFLETKRAITRDEATKKNTVMEDPWSNDLKLCELVVKLGNLSNKLELQY